MRYLAIALACLAAGTAHAAQNEPEEAAALRVRYGTLRDQLSHNGFQRPLYMDSGEFPASVSGGIYALVDYPFATVAEALGSAGNWCDILILHVNTKYCRASSAGQGTVLSMNIGEKFDQPLEETYPIVFAYRVMARTPRFLQIRLAASEGPLGTSDYRLVLNAIPLDDGRTFIHFAYSYGYGFLGKLMMRIYLETIGRGKVGFSVTGTQADGRLLYIGGMRGLVERNTMRYYLAIDAYLGSLSVQPQARLEKRLRDWFADIERYPRQLHEMEQGAYLEMKRKEVGRQEAALASPLTSIR